jgi:hypothetical protein
MSIDAVIDVGVLRTPIFLENRLSNRSLSAYKMIDRGPSTLPR